MIANLNIPSALRCRYLDPREEFAAHLADMLTVFLLCLGADQHITQVGSVKLVDVVDIMLKFGNRIKSLAAMMKALPLEYDECHVFWSVRNALSGAIKTLNYFWSACSARRAQ